MWARDIPKNIEKATEQWPKLKSRRGFDKM